MSNPYGRRIVQLVAVPKNITAVEYLEGGRQVRHRILCLALIDKEDGDQEILPVVAWDGGENVWPGSANMGTADLMVEGGI